MSESTLKPFTGKLDDNTDKKQQPTLKPFTGALDGEDKGFLGQTKDHAVSFFGKGAVGVGEVAVGLSNMMSDGATGKILSEKLGYDPKAAKNVMTGWQSEQYQQQLKDSANIGNRKIEEGDDFATKVGKKFDNAVDITKNAISNPSLITNNVAESLLPMFLSGALGRVSGIANPVVAGAVGEGAVMAGSQAEQIRQETVDGRLTADQSLASVGTGALGGLFSLAGGRLAQEMGLSDVDTAFQTGRLTTQQVGEEIAKTPMMAIPTAMIKGVISEGFLEELPQSVSEQILQNLALDKPWHDGIEDAAVMGTLAGMAMGGTVSGVGKTGDWLESSAQQRAIEKNWAQSEAEYQKNLLDEYRLRSHQEQEKVWNAQDDEKFLADLSHYINNKNGRFLNQPTEEMGNLGNQIGTGVNPNLLGFNPNNDPDAPITPNSPDTPKPNDNSPSGNYFDDPVNQPQPQLPSERLGINPNDGPMSSAAALAVDSGASPIAQLGYTPEQQSQEQSNTSISDAVPSNYQSLLGSQNDGQPFNANLEDATVQQENTQADNAGKSISQQYDANAADAMGGGIETDTAQTTSAQTVQPILGQDGKNKWFGNQEKAQAFIDKKDLGNDYQVVQDGNRFEIQPKAKSPVQDDAYFQSQLDQLDKQRAQFESSGDYANAEKVYAEMQTVAREWQTNSSTDTPTTKRAEPSKGASDNAWADFYRKNRNMISEELFMGGHQDRNALEEATPEIQSRHAHGMAKATPAAAVRDLKDILENGIDQNRGQGRLFTAPLSQGKLTAEQRSAMSASGTSSGSAYSDGAFTLIAKEGVGDIRSVSEIDAVMVNSAVPQEVVNGLRQDFPNMKFGYAKELPNLLSSGKQSNNVQAQVSELEQQLKGDDAHPLSPDLSAQLQEVHKALGRDVTRPQVERMIERVESEIATGVTNNGGVPVRLRPKAITERKQQLERLKQDLALFDQQKSRKLQDGNYAQNKLVTVKLKDGKSRQVYEHELNDQNIKSLTSFNENGERTAVKLSRSRLLSSDEHKAVNELNGNKSETDANKKVTQLLEKIKQVKSQIAYSDLKQAEVKQEQLADLYDEISEAIDDKPSQKHYAEMAQKARDFAKEMVKQNAINSNNEKAEAPKTENEKPKAEPEQPKAKVEPSKNTLVSDDRAAELRARLKAKLSQLNSGIDPEIMAIGAELAVYHIERGARKFAAFAKNIAADLDVSVEKIRPYLRSWYNGARDMMEDMGADIQGMDNSETVRAELAKLDNPQQQSNTVQSKTETVVTPAGREFEVRHKVVEASDLITSNLDSGAINAEYPQALQPRDRTTLKSITQVNDIANKLNPKLLGDSASSTNGAPIVSDSNEVESGNGRTLAIRKAYQTGKADTYKAWLADQGYDVANMQQPVLVRERITPMNMAERVAYTTESNERDTLDMSPSEQAMSDAPKVMDILHLVQGGSFNNTANRDFVNAFLTGVASKNERGTMLDKDGVSLTQDGYRRIESALLAAAFNDAQIISQVIESKDSDIKAIGNALIEVAPQWAQVRKGVQEGILVEGVNIEANLVEAVHLIRKARQQNLSLSEMLNQDDMFDGSIDQVTKDLVSIFYRGDKLDKARSSQKVADALKSYAQLAMTAKASPNLFGDAPLSTEQILGQVHDRLKQSEAEKQQDFFTSSQPNEPDTGAVGGGRSGRGAGTASETAQEQSEPAEALKKTAPTSEKETIQDFGEKIEGAKKDAAIGMSADVSANDIAQQPLSKVWDANAYKKDENKIRAAFNYVMRGELPAKPRVSYRVKAWVDKVLAARDAVNTFSGRSLDELSAIANENGVLGASIHKVMLLQDIPVEQWARIGEVREYPNAYGYDESGYKITSPKSSIEIDGKTLRFGTGSILDAASKAEILEKLGQQQEKAKPKTQLSINDFGIYRRNKDNSLFITRKADKEKRPLKEFEAGTSSRDVQQWLRDNLDLLSQTWEDVKNRDNVGKGDVRNESNRERTGRDWRDGKDVSDKDFMDAFGFRGVQFGNWVKQRERQQSLNEAYDALHDLASVLNIPTKAISLGGELGLAFGARGSGKAMAHFERSQVVINLTKTKGAGSLAHEWFHALDNYFSRQRGKSDSASREDSYITYKPEAMYRHKSQMSSPMTYAQLQSMHKRNPSSKYFDPQNWQKDPNHPQGVRPVVEKAFTELVNALNDSPMKQRASVLDNGAEHGYWSRIIELGARTFENYVISKMALNGVTNDYLANVKNWDLWQKIGKNAERYPYLKPAEEAPIVDAFDNLFSTIETVEDDKGNVRLYSRKADSVFTDAFTVAKSEQERIANDIERLATSLQSYPQPVQMKMPPVLLALDGVNGLSVQDLPLELDKQTLRKITGQVDGKQDAAHQLTLDQAKQLFGEITNPVMVLKSDTTGGLVIVTAMKNSNNAPVIAAIHLSKKKGRYVINEIASVYGKDNFETWIKNQAKNNNIVYLNENKSPDLVRQSPLQLRGVVHQNKALDGSSTATLPHFLGRLETAHVGVVGTRTSTQTILTPNDVVNFFERNGDTSLNSQSQSIQGTGTTTKQVRDKLVERFGKDIIAKLEQQGKLEILDTTPRHIKETGIEGYFENGKAVLVASNLTDDTIIPTFLHELGGHAGFQNMMKPEQYADLMRQFDRMVEQGNPIALEAKKLAEREQGSERQQLEYLPYLLTLASNMQIKHAIHKGSVTRLISDLISKVKAWIYDRLGVNLNLNPNDMVALAERMVAQATQAKANTNDAENANSPLYSRQSMQDTIDRLGQNIRDLSVQSVRDKAGFKWADWLGVGLQFLGRRQLTEIYAKLLPQLNKYNELAAQMDADKNDAGAKADSIVREWANLNDEDQLAELMHDSTLAKIDPTKPYVSGDSISKYRQLRDAYNSLSPEAQAMYVKARDAYKQHYAEVHQAIKERILRSELSNQKKADLLKQMDNQFFGYTKGVYFPLARFGKYVVVMRNQNGEVESVSRTETRGEARALRSELMKKYPDFEVGDVLKDPKFSESRDGVGRGFMSNLYDEVGNLGLDAKAQAEFEDTLAQLYLTSLPDLSWAKHGIHRKGTAGFSQDARRAFAQNMFSGANYLAKLRYGDQLAQQLDEMKKHSKEQYDKGIGYDQPTAQSVIDEMEDRHKNLMNPESSPLSSALTSLGFIYYLGLSPAAAMVNLSQTVLVAYPLMGAKWNFDKAGKELLKAAEQFRKGVEFHKVKWEGTKTDLYKAVSADISKFLNDDEKKAYQKAVDSGVIDVTQAHDLAGIAQGEDSGVMWKTRPIMRAASVMFHSAERFNREVTFIAAYRLARQYGADHDSAFDQAVDMTYKGHFDYSSGNRPRIMQGNVAKVVLLFKQFGQNMLYTLARQTYQSIKGETKEERREARRAISAILAMHATFAGALGLPGVWFIMAIASWMGGDDDEPWNAEVALRNYLAEAFNPTISNMLMKGAPRGIGVDISSRVGINNLLLPDVQEGLEGKKLWDSAASAALGPIGGIGANIAKGAQEISEGHNLRGVESMLPVFLKNFAKTYRYADEGVQDKTGVSILDEVDSMDLLVQSMGFSPADVRTANEGKSAIYQYDRKLSERRSRLMTLWSRAKMLDDQQEMDEIWEEIQGFNEKNPSLRITRINLNQSYRQRQRRIDRAEDGIYLPRNRQDARDAGYFAFGE